MKKLLFTFCIVAALVSGCTDAVDEPMVGKDRNYPAYHSKISAQINDILHQYLGGYTRSVTDPSLLNT